MAAILSSETASSVDPDFSATPVPSAARMSKGSLSMAWWALFSSMFWLVVTATLAINYGAGNAIVGMMLSVMAYGVINGVITRYAIRTGLSVGLFSRRVYGRAGEILATVIFFSTAIYYGVFEGSVIALAIQDYFPSLSLWQAYLLVVLYSVPLVFGSVRLWLDKLNGFLLPFYILGLIAAVGFAVHHYGYSNDWLTLGPRGDEIDSRWLNCFTYFMGIWIMMMYTWDYARFGKPEDERYHARINFGIPFYLCTFLINGLIGVFLAATIPTDGELSETSIVFAILKLMGFWGLLFIWVSQTRINTANFQLATVNLQAFMQRVVAIKLSKVLVAMLVGAIVFVVMLTDVFSFILTALAYQGIFVVAWVTIAVSYILLNEWLLTKPHTATIDSVPVSGGLWAWFAASAIGLLLLNGSPQLSVWSAPVTALVAAVVFILLTRKRAGEELSVDYWVKEER